MAHGHAVSAMAAGLGLKASSKLVSRLRRQPYRNAANFFFPTNVQMVAGGKTSHHAIIRTMLRMACKVMVMMAVVLLILHGR